MRLVEYARPVVSLALTQEHGPPAPGKDDVERERGVAGLVVKE